jgi:hypothetical protein
MIEAARGGYIPVVQALINARADVRARNKVKFWIYLEEK